MLDELKQLSAFLTQSIKRKQKFDFL